MPALDFFRKLLPVVSGVSVVVWVLSVLMSNHHHAITFWLVIALGLVALTFCSAWLDARATVQRLRSPDPFESWVQRRLDAAAVIKRQRPARGNGWFADQAGQWESENVNQMGGYDNQGRSTANGLATDLVDDYRRQCPGIARPHTVAQIAQHFECQIAWLRRTQRNLRGRSRVRQRAVALRGRLQAALRAWRGSSGLREAEREQDPGRGGGEGPRVENCCKLIDRLGRWYLRNVHGAVTSVVRTPGDANRAGVAFLIWRDNPTSRIGRKTPGKAGEKRQLARPRRAFLDRPLSHLHAPTAAVDTVSRERYLGTGERVLGTLRHPLAGPGPLACLVVDLPPDLERFELRFDLVGDLLVRVRVAGLVFPLNRPCPVTIWRCECWLCGHQVRVSVERIVQMDDTNNASWG